ncbi:hypothetical protein CPB83DRAFT_844770 [Crepidotus variabilis]|uniref:Uncharacterized protein n=1 Tax=Crepidotus variabilis TaxID=179855 RepID=A0A9P6ES85_9AGAR|nr:hypothetical protein CPB83DRAFT_844770 [Crepidotus variabilis]
MNIYLNRYFYVFVAALTAFLLLLLSTVSTPIATTFYLLYSTHSGGIRFGIWGWCLDDGTCSNSLKLGYTYDSAITTSVTAAFVLYPISVIISFCNLLSIIPSLYLGTLEGNKFFYFCVWASIASSAFAFLFAIGIGSVAVDRLSRDGSEASLGNLPWMTLAAMLLLLAIAASPFIFLPPPQEPRRSHSTRTRAPPHHGADLEARPSRRSTSRHVREKGDRH